MAATCLIGTQAFDAIAYSRALSSDTTAPFVIPDSSYELYVEDTVEDFSRFSALDYVVGNPYAATSPLVTVAGQQRYICNVANGFTVEPARITDVSYIPSGDLANITDWGAVNLMPFPFSPFGRFFLANTYIVDNPSFLTLRSGYRDTLDRIYPGYWNTVRDPATGLWAIDVYPIPGQAALPIYVRYQGVHLNTGNTTNSVYPTIPDAYARVFARLLYCMAVEQNLDYLARAGGTKAGILQETSTPEALERKLARIRNGAYRELGASVPAVLHTA